jgi:polar amino acid transport system substrate-binding protein
MHAQRNTLVRVFTLVAVVVSAFVVLSAEPRTLRLVSTAWPPFTNDTGQPRFALDLVEAAFSRIGVTSTTAIVPAPQFTSALMSGAFDGSGAAWKDPQREAALIFSDPYLENRLVLVGRRGSDVSATSLTSLGGKRIAIVAGYSYGDAAQKSGPAFVRTQTEEESVSRLLGGSADYTLMDELVVRYITSNYAAQAREKLAIGTMPLVVRPLHLALRKDAPDAAGIIARFNSQLRGMIADHTYHRLLHVDWIRADIDGDGVPEYVPSNDKLGSSQPQSAYVVSTAAMSKGAPASEPRFYIGGNIYRDWASVPESYKSTANDGHDDPRRSMGSVFTFHW